MKTPAPTPRDREAGFSLVEIMVTMVLLAVTLMSLMPVTLRVAKLGAQATASAQRTGVLAGEIQRIQLVGYTSLATGTTCTDNPTASYPNTTCVTVKDIDATTKQVSVSVTAYGGGTTTTSTTSMSLGTRYNPLAP